MVNWLQLVVCLFSMLAALFWLRSSLVQLPAVTETQWAGSGPFPAALAEQSRLNARAALCAAVAAACQGLSFLLTSPLVRP